MVVETLTRPYPVSVPMVVLVLLVPSYILIAELASERTLHVPEVALDRVVPLQPAWVCPTSAPRRTRSAPSVRSATGRWSAKSLCGRKPKQGPQGLQGQEN